MEICKYCGTALIEKRSDAQYCSDNCRIKAHLHRERVEKKKLPVLEAIRTLENRVTEILMAIADFSEYVAQTKQRLQEIKKQLIDKVMLYNMHYEKYRIEELGYADQEFIGVDIPEVNRALNNLAYMFPVQDGKLQLTQEIKALQQEGQQLKMMEAKYQQQITRLTYQLEETEQQIAIHQQQLQVLEARKQRSPVKKRSRQRVVKPRQIDQAGISVKDFMKLQFETLTMPMGLGTFLGKLDLHQLSIVLTGDPGAGKSYFLCALARMFSYMDFSICYFQLEQGLGKVMQDILLTYPVNADKVVLQETATLEDIRQAANCFDAVLIDSFGKVSEDAKDFDALRKEFPSVLFISIFQKTSDGSTRGGSRVDFDGSMKIDIVRREGRPIAIMRKNRYGSQGWEYDIGAEMIIKRWDKMV